MFLQDGSNCLQDSAHHVKPCKGSAILFYNLLSDGSYVSASLLHCVASMPWHINLAYLLVQLLGFRLSAAEHDLTFHCAYT